jgi:hypothetical protein
MHYMKFTIYQLTLLAIVNKAVAIYQQTLLAIVNKAVAIYQRTLLAIVNKTVGIDKDIDTESPGRWYP